MSESDITTPPGQSAAGAATPSSRQPSDRRRERASVGPWRWAVIRTDELGECERHVALTLAVFMDADGGGARPGTRTLVEACRRRREHVLAALDQLDALGFLDRDPGSGTRATRYTATLPAKAASGSDVGTANPPDTPPSGSAWGTASPVDNHVPAPASGSALASSGSALASSGSRLASSGSACGTGPASKTSNKDLKEPKPKSTVVDDPPLFEAFKAAYPSKDGRPLGGGKVDDVRRAFESLDEQDQRQAITAAHTYAANFDENGYGNNGGGDDNGRDGYDPIPAQSAFRWLEARRFDRHPVNPTVHDQLADDEPIDVEPVTVEDHHEHQDDAVNPEEAREAREALRRMFGKSGREHPGQAA